MGIAERKAREQQQRKESILEASQKLFIEQGPETVTIEMIAEEAEIGKGTVYKHFKSKSDIFASLVMRRGEMFLQELQKIDRTLPAEERIRVAIRIFLKLIFNDPRHFQVFQNCEHNIVPDQLCPCTQEKYGKLTEKKHQLINDLLQQGIDEGVFYDIPFDEFYPIVYGVLNGSLRALVNESFTKQPDDLERFFKTVEDFIVRGILKK